MPGRIRTCDLRIRNPLLYPTELRALDIRYCHYKQRDHQSTIFRRLSVSRWMKALLKIITHVKNDRLIQARQKAY